MEGLMYRLLKVFLIVLVTAFTSTWAATYFGSNPITRTIGKVVAQSVEISELAREPAKYDGWVVQVTGRLNQNTKVAAFGMGSFTVQDGNGNKLTVLVRNGIPSV